MTATNDVRNKIQRYRNGGEGLIEWAEDFVHVPIYPEGADIATWVPLGDLPTKKNPSTGRSYRDLWRRQQEVLVKALEMKNGRFLHTLIVFCWQRGDGKCESKGSTVLMFDGSVKKVEDVKVGDLLMGDDNTPRKVLSLHSGIDDMVEVVPMRGNSLIVTKDHILSLKRRDSPEIIDIAVNVYQQQSKPFQESYHIYRVPPDKAVVSTPIKAIKPAGQGEYYGFTLDGNGRYVKSDFTVTHNSFEACLIQAWKFFNWTRQNIVLGANSKDQVKFVHYDIIRDMIFNSPGLLKLIGGPQNIREKEIRLKKAGSVQSIIRSISSFSGIVSNITGYTFSEMFDMKNPKFFTQLDGSIRNVPNALGVIDSTVSTKDHVLYKLYKSYVAKENKLLFFSYRYSKDGLAKDFWHPYMTDDQLNSYRTKFPAGQFEQYFKNLWTSGVNKVFTAEQVKAMRYVGCNGSILNHYDIGQAIREHYRWKNQVEYLEEVNKQKHGAGMDLKGIQEYNRNAETALSSLIPVQNFYSLQDNFGIAKLIEPEELTILGDKINSDFAILMGMDLGDPYAKKGYARTIVTVIAKCLPNSRDQYLLGDGNHAYIYFLIGLFNIESHSNKDVKSLIERVESELGGVDAVCSERFGAWDMQEWCAEKNIRFTPVYPNYARQSEAVKEFYTLLQSGRFKTPPTAVNGTQDEDILVEEILNFDHIVLGERQTGYFGSPTKLEKYGIQDDAVFSVLWTIYGGMGVTIDQFHPLKGDMNFGFMFRNTGLLGRY